MSKRGLAKIALSIILLLLVARAVDFSKLSSVISEISPGLVFVVVAGYAFGQLLSSCRWWLIARAAGIDSSYMVALRAFFIGTFLNCFGLGMVGGDVARGILIARNKPLKLAGVSSVLADRLHGLATLAALGGVAILIFGRLSLEPMLAWCLGLGSLSIALGWIFGPMLVLRFVPTSHKLRQKVEEMTKAFPRSPKTITIITAISMVFHLVQLGLHWVMGLCVGVNIPIAVILVFVPFVNIFSSLPISWNGLGVREKSYIFFLTPAILTSEKAVAFSAIWLLAIIVSSAIGGLVAFLSEDLSLAKLERAQTQVA